MQFIKSVYQLIFIGLLVVSCSSVGSNFFIENLENKSVKIQYNYYSEDPSGFKTEILSPPADYILFSDTLLPKKVIRQFPYKGNLYFDTVANSRLDTFSYVFEMPAHSIIRIAPIYYSDNIESIVINEKDTIRFNSDYPKVEVEALVDNKIVRYKPRIIGDSYLILSVRLVEIEKCLKDSKH